jgi:hypothetical protein
LRPVDIKQGQFDSDDFDLPNASKLNLERRPSALEHLGVGGVAADYIVDNIDVQNPAVDEITWQSSWYLEKASSEVVRNTLEGKADGTFIVRDHPSNDDEFILNYRSSQMTHALGSECL